MKDRIPGQAAEGVEIGHRQRRAKPAVAAHAGDADHAAERLVEALALDDFFHRRGTVVGAQIEVEHLLPHGREIDEMPLLAGVLLRDLQLHGRAGFLEARKERRHRLARLEVDGAFFDLHDHVRGELAVERMEDVVGGARAVGLGVVAVEVVVVDKGAIKHHAAVRRERVGQQVGGVGGGAAIAGRAGLALGVGLDRESGEVGNERVNLVDLGGPPGLHCRIERVEGLEAADLLRAGDVDADGQTHAPGAHGVGDALEALR